MTTEAKWTPGPWCVDGVVDARYLRGIGDVLLVRRAGDRDDRYVALASLDMMGDGTEIKTEPAEREANARLIAASPDLYAACVLALPFAEAELGARQVELLDGEVGVSAEYVAEAQAAVDALRAAIARAEGRTP